MRILAIDLGKCKSVACKYTAATGEHTFETFQTRPQMLHDLLVAVRPERVVIEVCSAAGWVGDLVRALEIELQVANTNHEAWRWKNVKRKTDRDDALKLAQLSAMNQLPLVHLPEKDVRAWRSLIQFRGKLVGRRTRIKNHIRSILDREGLRMAPGKSGWTKAWLKRLGALAEATAEGMAALWQFELSIELVQYEAAMTAVLDVEYELGQLAKGDERVKRLRTIPGVGPRLSEALVAVLDDPKRFKSGKQVGAYVGLTPRLYESGSMSRQGKISKQGHRYLRSLLVEVAWIGLRHNPWMREVYERVRRGSKTRKKIAIVAVARRLLIRCWAMLRDGTNWSPPALGESAVRAA